MCCLQRNFIAQAPAVHEIPKGRFRSDSASAALSGFKILQQVQNLSFSIFFLSFFLSIFSLGLGVKSKGLLHHQNTTFSQKRKKAGTSSGSNSRARARFRLRLNQRAICGQCYKQAILYIEVGFPP